MMYETCSAGGRGNHVVRHDLQLRHWCRPPVPGKLNDRTENVSFPHQFNTRMHRYSSAPVISEPLLYMDSLPVYKLPLVHLVVPLMAGYLLCEDNIGLDAELSLEDTHEYYNCSVAVLAPLCTHSNQGECRHTDVSPQPVPPHHSVILSWHWTNQSLPYPNNAVCQARKWQVSILKSLVWFNQGSNQQGWDSNTQGSDSPISQHRRRMLYSFGHPILYCSSNPCGVKPMTYIIDTCRYNLGARY